MHPLTAASTMEPGSGWSSRRRRSTPAAVPGAAQRRRAARDRRPPAAPHRRSLRAADEGGVRRRRQARLSPKPENRRSRWQRLAVLRAEVVATRDRPRLPVQARAPTRAGVQEARSQRQPPRPELRAAFDAHVRVTIRHRGRLTSSLTESGARSTANRRVSRSSEAHGRRRSIVRPMTTPGGTPGLAQEA